MSLSFLYHAGESDGDRHERWLSEGEYRQEVENDDKALNAGVLGRMLPVPVVSWMTTAERPPKAVAEMSARRQHSEPFQPALAWRYHGGQGPWNCWLARHDLIPPGALAPHLGKILS
jgi:hypothetical protein